MEFVLDKIIDDQPHLCDLQLYYGIHKGGLKWDYPFGIPFTYCTTLVVLDDSSYYEFNVNNLLGDYQADEGIPLFAQCYTDLLLYRIWPELFTSTDLDSTNKMVKENKPNNFKFIIVSTKHHVDEIIAKLKANPENVDDIYYKIIQEIMEHEFAIFKDNKDNTKNVINSFYTNSKRGK